MLPISENTKRLLKAVYDEQNSQNSHEDSGITKLRVSEIVSRMAFYYEKIRNTLDYKEEYLLRKSAIFRILKRKIVIESVVKEAESENIAKDLLMELIRGAYLPNDKIPETKIKEVAAIIEKYLKLRNICLASFELGTSLKAGRVDKANKRLKERNRLSRWLLALLASEIESSFEHNKIKEIIVKDMYSILSDVVKLPTELPYDKDLKIQVYIGIHRNFLKFDSDMLSLILFKYFYPVWSSTSVSNENIANIAAKMKILQDTIYKQLNHPLRKQLSKIVNKYTVFYTIFIDTIADKPLETYNQLQDNPNVFGERVIRACNNKYEEIKSKLWRASIRSIVYIFITKSVLVFALEVPTIRFFGEKLDPIALLINITFPAGLLFLMALSTEMPNKENTQKILEGINSIVFSGVSNQDSYILNKPNKRKAYITIIFGLFYTVTYFLSFGLVIYGLNKIHFTWVSITIFLFFLAMVSFFGIRIRTNAREFNIVEKQESMASFVIDFLYIPIVTVGKYITEKFSHLNVFVLFFDFIVETPFKIMVDLVEQWTNYVKERKDEII